nr:DUF3265 domain-containing protein [Vibrio parahaemolyticus]
MSTSITNNLRVIRHTWHFYYALVSVFKVQWFRLGD